MANEELLFLPLGGAGEIGMNLNLYGYGEPGHATWMMIDLGISFGDGTHPGVDVIMPDPAYIEQHKDQLAGIVLTHAHEDHLGAVPYLWERFGVPIYATPFTVSIVQRKLAEVGLLDIVPIVEIPLNGSFEVGPFELDLITLTHSIPEPNGIAIKTPLGTVLHTGDWKLDPDPVIGEPSDMPALRRLGDEGVLAIVCDSTNVFTEGTSGSEGAIFESMRELVSGCTGRVVVTCFASNVARLDTLFRVAQACGRSVALAGRSFGRMVDAARENGYLKDIPPILDEDHFGDIPKENVMLICTGSQGEPRAALSRIAADDHPRLYVSEGDTVIFSSRQIPGNEVSIGRLQNRLVRRGVEVITDSDHFIHVSGHPARDELLEMYQAVKPELSIPVHGELRHLTEHAKLAKSAQVPHAIVNENGGMIRIAPGPASIIEQVPSGRLALEGGRVVPLDGELVRGRVRALFNGSATITIVIDKVGNILGDPILTTSGLLEPNDVDVEDDVLDEAEMAIERLSKKDLRKDDIVSEAVRIAVRRYFRNTFDKNAVTSVHLVRV
ncbi:ribonuclease J [Magnetovibrio sp. PR-2]|uniref:ribonuclease J n=1 Tax=Magnetovibrio sp. PR-2 TaxID=3120356 RepID=UPI002FCDE47C